MNAVAEREEEKCARRDPALFAAAWLLYSMLAPTFLAAWPATAQDILGKAPTYAARKPGTIPDVALPNADAMTRRIWVPGLDEGHVPQGLAVVGDAIYVSTYLSADRRQDRGPCRLWRLDPGNGRVTGMLDLPPSCGHAGGVANGAAGRIWVVDTHLMHEIALTPEDAASPGRVLREVAIRAPLKGSFATAHDGALWLGSYERDAPGRLHRVPLAGITGAAIGEAEATTALVVPSRAQGAAFDSHGRLWLTRSGSTFGEIVRLDAATGKVEARFPLPDGVEGLSFDMAGGIWTVSEAGSRRWQGWATFFPVIFRLDSVRLR